METALAAETFTGAAVEFGRGSDARLRLCLGREGLLRTSRAIDEHSYFDLASLTKVVATTPAIKALVTAKTVTLTDRIARWVPEWRGPDRDAATLTSLLTHASGLPAHLPLYEDHRGLDSYVGAICRTPLAYEPEQASVYSDLGFILLAAIAERATHRGFDELARIAMEFDRADEIVFTPRDDIRSRCVTTGFDDWRGRELVGEVHDRNAYALGGVAGHAGLFGTLPAVGHFASAVMSRLRASARDVEGRLDADFAKRTSLVGSSRALGWDTMLPTSSCGPDLSPTAIGHTGFTGTSIWIDWERDVYSVLLTNRVATHTSAADVLALRRAVHSLSATFAVGRS
jgi:CubicO group peptidase (beta-lactamase class C family)